MSDSERPTHGAYVRQQNVGPHATGVHIAEQNNYFAAPSGVPRSGSFRPEKFHFSEVPRPREVQAIADRLLRANRDHLRSRVHVVTCVGPGGSGKTTLVTQVCNLPEVRELFPDAIWVRLGQQPNVLSELTTLIFKLTRQQPALLDEHEGSDQLRLALEGRNALLVLDDVWNARDARPFLKAAGIGLVTTRSQDVACTYPGHTVEVGEMSVEASVAVLKSDVATEWNNRELRELASELAFWPLTLGLAAAHLRKLIRMGRKPSSAVARVRHDLRQHGFAALENEQADDRNRSVAACLNVSFKLLDAALAAGYLELGIFPRSAVLPISVIQRFWLRAGAPLTLDATDACEKLFELSLLTRYDPEAGTVQLHDVLHEYLQNQTSAERRVQLHAAFLDAERRNLPRWSALSEENRYLWEHIGYHWVSAQRLDEMRECLLDCDWLVAKLSTGGVAGARHDISRYCAASPQSSEELDQLGRALALSASALNRRPEELKAQLLGRLKPEGQLAHVLERARATAAGPSLLPRSPSLLPPGGALRWSFNTGALAVDKVATSPDDTKLVVQANQVLHVWDLATGLSVPLKGGEAADLVGSGRARAVKLLGGKRYGNSKSTMSGDGTRCARTLNGTLTIHEVRRETLQDEVLTYTNQLIEIAAHKRAISCIALSNDASLALTSDGTSLRLWDALQGRLIFSFAGHASRIQSVAFSRDARFVVSGCKDGSVRVWELQQVRASGHLFGGAAQQVRAMAVGPTLALAGSFNEPLEVWNHHTCSLVRSFAEGSTPDHKGQPSVSAAALSLDERKLIAASDSKSLRLWGLDSGRRLRTVNPPYGKSFRPSERINGLALIGDSRALSVSAGGTLRDWDLEHSCVRDTFIVHGGPARCVAADQRGQVAATGGEQRGVHIWDLLSKTELHVLEGHERTPTTVAFSSDGELLATAAQDLTVKVWHWRTRRELASFTGDAVFHALCFDGADIIAVDALRRVHRLELRL